MTLSESSYPKIPLTRGQVAVVSPEDYPALSRYNWYAHRERRGNFYAARCISKGKIEMMHRVICNTPAGLVTDHINRNTLDNRRSNLRAVSAFENQQNRSMSRNNTTGFHGVQFRKDRGVWRFRVQLFGKNASKSGFKSAEAAHRARERYIAGVQQARSL